MTGMDVVSLIAEGCFNKGEETVVAINDIVATLLDENINSKFANELGCALEQWCLENEICPLCGKNVKKDGSCECGFTQGVFIDE